MYFFIFLFLIIRKIFSVIEFRQPQEINILIKDPKSRLTRDTILTRRKACYALIHICNESSIAVAANMNKLIEYLEPLISSEIRILDSEKSCILESLVAAR